MSNLQTVPLSSKLLVNYFEDNSITYDIDYLNSKLRGKSFVNYLYNIQIDTNVAVSDDMSFNEKSELMLAWLEFRDVVSVDTLSYSLLNLLLIEKRAQIRFPSIFSEGESLKFIDENEEIITHMIEFMDSIVLFLLHKFDKQPIETFKVNSIDDPKYVPANLANIFAIEEFYVYYSLPFREKSWFVKQFENKHNVIVNSFLLAKNNILLGFINAIVKNKITPEDYCKFINAKI